MKSFDINIKSKQKVQAIIGKMNKTLKNKFKKKVCKNYGIKLTGHLAGASPRYSLKDVFNN